MRSIGFVVYVLGMRNAFIFNKTILVGSLVIILLNFLKNEKKKFIMLYPLMIRALCSYFHAQKGYVYFLHFMDATFFRLQLDRT